MQVTSSPPDIAGAGPAGLARPWLPASARPYLPGGAWAGLWGTGIAVMVVLPRWATVSFYLIWIGFALLYGLRIWPWQAAALLTLAVAATTGAATGLNVLRGLDPPGSLIRVPLLPILLGAIIWQTQHRMTSGTGPAPASAEDERQLAAQRRFLIDASHQLKTPITIALGHAELLASQIVSQDGRRDIHVVVGELNRLKSLSERLLLIAASENPDFLSLAPVPLAPFAVELLYRWRPAAARRWRAGQLDDAVVSADADRLALAMDALLENAVQHTADGDLIAVSVQLAERARFASVVIEDSGEGIPAAELAHIFDRFRSGPAAATGRRGTGLGLALAQAIARGHGGEVRVNSIQGQGSRFEFLLPLLGGTR